MEFKNYKEWEEYVNSEVARRVREELSKRARNRR